MKARSTYTSQKREFMTALHTRNRLGPIWIDEVWSVRAILSDNNQTMQVHTFCSKGRFREGFDDFWNLGANLNTLEWSYVNKENF